MPYSNIEFVPTKSEMLLLNAILFPGIDTFHQWKSNVDINDLNHGETRLLPHLYHALNKQNIKDPLTEKLKGLVRRTWILNTKYLHHALPYLQALKDEKLPFCTLKGAAMTFAVYKDLSVRSMQDIDILVNRANIRRAVTIIKSQGFKAMEPCLNLEDYFEYRHSLGYRNKEGSIIDLHCYVLEECCRDQDRHPFLKFISHSSFAGREIPVSQPTELLFHTLAHGMRWNLTSSIRWIVDASALLNRFPINWTRFFHYAEKYELVTPIKASLTLLKKEFQQEFPPDVLARLEELNITKADYREFRFHTSEFNGVASSFRHIWNHYKRTKAPETRSNLLLFCKKYWGIEKYRHLPRALVVKLKKKVLHTL